jgi:hypothetical protein
MIDRYALLLRVGTMLYGPSWQTSLAEALGVNLRTVQRWAAGERLPGNDTWGKLADLVRRRREDLTKILDEIADGRSPPADVH